MRNRIRGCLLGQAIGDSLGARYEFESNDVVIKHMQRDIVQNFLPILGGGPFDVYPGQVTDDTELAMANLHTLIEKRRIDFDSIAHGYVLWHFSHPFDEGHTTQNAFKNTSPTLSPQMNRDLMHSNANKFNSISCSNGSLMRISPIAIVCGQYDVEDISRIVREDSSLTHGHELVWFASTAYAIAVSSLIKYGDKLIAYQSACNFANSVDPLLYRILKMAKSCPDPVECTDGAFAKTDSHRAGYFGIALQNAFYELLNGVNFEHSLIDVVKRGGDTDTNGAITAALLGAYYGSPKMPSRWIKTVLSANPTYRTKQYPWADTRDLINQADQLCDIYYPKLNYHMHMKN